jgi:hypothetical protein
VIEGVHRPRRGLEGHGDVMCLDLCRHVHVSRYRVG